jgi:hypothetical protein
MNETTYVIDAPTGEPTIGYAKAAPLYAKNGFKPVPIEGKVLLVRGATGRKGQVTLTKIADWSRKHPTAGVALRAEGFISLDVDHHDKKFGHDQLLGFIQKFGELPPTVSSTARGKESPSRQYFFRVDEEIPLQSDPAPDIEIIQRTHRYSVVAPSVHPVIGRPYLWFGPDGSEMTRLPLIEDFAYLPNPWLFGLSRQTRSIERDGVYGGDIDAWMHWLGNEEPWWPAQSLLVDINACNHIGHNELMRFVYRIHKTRLEGENSLGPIFASLVELFRATTNNAEWSTELENAVRWVIGAEWSPDFGIQIEEKTQ